MYFRPNSRPITEMSSKTTTRRIASDKLLREGQVVKLTKKAGVGRKDKNVQVMCNLYGEALIEEILHNTLIIASTAPQYNTTKFRTSKNKTITLNAKHLQHALRAINADVYSDSSFNINARKRKATPSKDSAEKRSKADEE